MKLLDLFYYILSRRSDKQFKVVYDDRIEQKKVLHEHKRHTACRVASTRCGALSLWSGGTPIQSEREGTPY